MRRRPVMRTNSNESASRCEQHCCVALGNHPLFGPPDSRIKVPTGQWAALRAAKSGGHYLIHANVARLKFERTGCHIQAPHSIPRFAHRRQYLVMMLLQAIYPMPQSEYIVWAHCFHIETFETSSFHAALDIADAVELATLSCVALGRARYSRNSSVTRSRKPAALTRPISNQCPAKTRPRRASACGK
jgi:hypothetical protein